MIYLLLAILTSTSIVVTFKVFKSFNISVLQAITINYVTASGFGFLTNENTFQFAQLAHQPWFGSALIVGITLIVAFNLYALSAQHAGIAITAISSRMSVVIPVSFGFLLFGDTAGWLKVTGIVIAIVALYFTSKKERTDHVITRYFYLPLLLFLAFGANDTLLKVAEHFFITDDFTLFLATAFLAALVPGVVILIFKWQSGNEKFQFKNVIAGVILGILNWYSTLYFLKGIDVYEVSVFVPAFNIGVVVLAGLTGYLFFKEKLSSHNIAGIFLAILAIVLLSFG
jgi:drug/metabolite transporter (DMT)-like permease